MTDLKPCPFCGGDVKITIGVFGSSMIVCDKCGADVCFYGAEVIDKAIDAWNRRNENG